MYFCVVFHILSVCVIVAVLLAGLDGRLLLRQGKCLWEMTRLRPWPGLCPNAYSLDFIPQAVSVGVT